MMVVKTGGVKCTTVVVQAVILLTCSGREAAAAKSQERSDRG